MEFASVPPVSGSSNAPEHSRVLGVIPARLSSSRLPEKPLHPIHGRPLVEWVWRRAAAMSCLDAVVVATDSERIAEVVRDFGGRVLLTDPDHPSGTDRVAEVVGSEGYTDYPIVANLQGDEPLLAEAHVAAAIARVREDGFDVGTCATPIRSLEELEDPSAVKVVCAPDGRALTFSRAEIPWVRERSERGRWLADGAFLRHVGLYVYRRDALEAWVARPESRLERMERLEQLRALEAGTSIGVAVVEGAVAGVDTPEDVRRIERALAQAGANLNAETTTA